MTIIEAIKEAYPAEPRKPVFIQREKWRHIITQPDGGVKLLPTDSPDGMIVYSEAVAHGMPVGGWAPTAEDLIANDWVVTW